MTMPDRPPCPTTCLSCDPVRECEKDARDFEEHHPADSDEKYQKWLDGCEEEWLLREEAARA